MLNERCIELFKKIIGSKGPVKIAALAAAMTASARSVRYDLNKIDVFLADCEAGQLVRKNTGIAYPVSSKEAEAILQRLREVEPFHYSTTQAERQDVILAVLLQQRAYITIDQLAQKLDVGRTTIGKDLQLLRKYLATSELELLSSTNRGIKIAGDEKYLRRATIALLRRNVNEHGNIAKEIVPAVNVLRQIPQREINKLFDKVNIRLIEQSVTEAEKQLEITFSDEAFYGLVIHIAIAIQRIRLGKDIRMGYEQLKNYETLKEFAAASFIAKKLEKEFRLRVPYDEIGYITIHLLGSNGYAANPQYSKDWAQVGLLTGQILQAVSERIHRPELLKDNQLFIGLQDHLRPAMYRLKNGLYITNPVLAGIKADYAALFAAVKSSMFPVEDLIGKIFNEEEIGYFTLHFGAALEKHSSVGAPLKRVLVVCSTGIGTARLLASRLERIFQVKVAQVAAYRQVKQLLQDQSIDLIITTLAIKIPEVPCLQVSPLMTERDIAYLKQYLPEHKGPSNRLLPHILHLIAKYCEIKEYNALVDGLAQILDVDTAQIDKGGEQPLLIDLLTEQSIALKVKANSWEEVVRAGGKIMMDNGLIEARYTEAMVNTVKEMGAYIVIVPGIAMPHARPEDGAKKVGMTIVTLEKPVEFGHAENDPVTVAVFLCAVDKVTHLRALADLMELLEDENFKATAEEAGSAAELLQYMQSKLKEES